MRIEYLEEFESLANELNYSRVAKMHHESTSVLSRHIAALEKEVGETLFERDTTHVELTAAGRSFLQGLIPVLEAYHAFRRDFENSSARTKRQVRVLLLRSAPLLAQAAAVTTHRLQQNEGINVTYQTMTQAGVNQFAPVEDGRFNAAITYDSKGLPEGYRRVKLFHDPFVAVVPISNPLARQREISLVEDLSQRHTVILKSPQFQAGADALTDIFRHFGVPIVPEYFYADTQEALCYSPTFEGVLPVPRSALPRHPYLSPETHVVLPFREDIGVNLTLVFPERNATSALMVYADALSSACRKLQEQP